MGLDALFWGWESMRGNGLGHNDSGLENGVLDEHTAMFLVNNHLGLMNIASSWIRLWKTYNRSVFYTLYQIGIQLWLMDVFRPTLLKTIEIKDDATQDEQKMEAWMLHGSRICDILLLV